MRFSVVVNGGKSLIHLFAPAALPLLAPFSSPNLKKAVDEDLLHCSPKLQLRNPPSVHR